MRDSGYESRLSDAEYFTLKKKNCTIVFLLMQTDRKEKKDRELQDSILSKRLSINIPLLPESKEDSSLAAFLVTQPSKTNSAVRI